MLLHFDISATVRVSLTINLGGRVVTQERLALETFFEQPIGKSLPSISLSKATNRKKPCVYRASYTAFREFSTSHTTSLAEKATQTNKEIARHLNAYMCKIYANRKQNRQTPRPSTYHSRVLSKLRNCETCVDA